MANNPLVELTKSGQSVWHDSISRSFMASGELKRLIDEDDLRGVTSNPAIFEKAISGSDDYLEQVRELAEQEKNATEIYEALAVQDIQAAADVLAPVYDKTGGIDGYVSLECSPFLAHDTQGTIDEAIRLWKWVDRKNVMIKIPGTPEGMPAIEECLYQGLNINITLLFSLDAYRETIEAYMRALERRVGEGKPIDSIASVASFFVSRIDTAVDKRLEEKLAAVSSEEEKENLRGLEGRIAIANAKMAYEVFKEEFGGDRFQKLREHGAKVQRPLWASTSTKNPEYSDVYYVEALIGPDTVDTLPPETIKAFRDHGKVARTLDANLDEERAILARLEAAGISLEDVTDQVLAEGVAKFAEPFEKLLNAIRARRDEVVAERGRSAQGSTGQGD